MYNIKVVLLLVFAGICCATPDRIIGGNAASMEDYPSLVQLDYLVGNWGQNCGASVLNNLYVLSAAQCTSRVFDVNYRIEYRRIRAGSCDRNYGGSIHEVVAVHNHPHFDPWTYEADITVIRLKTALVYGPMIQPATVISPDYEVPENMPVVKAGWGVTSTSTSWQSSSPVLLDVTVYTINQQLCANRYHNFSPQTRVTNNMICTGILDQGGRGSCRGDTGGPVYFGGVLVGITSWALRCADGYLPGVNTKVSPFTRWITATAV